MDNIYLDESIIHLDMEVETKEEILTVMSNNLIDNKLVKDSFRASIIKRETEFATGLPTGGVSVAIPHTDVEHVNRRSISVAVLKTPVLFGVMGDPVETTPVKVVFMLAMDESDSQLSLLQRLMQIFQDEETLLNLASETSRSNVKRLLENKLDFALKGGE